MNRPKVYADFHNADPHGRVRLNCVGTVEDLARQQVELRDGLVLRLYMDDADDEGRPAELQVDGAVTYCQDEHGWVAILDWNAIQQVPVDSHQASNGTAQRPETPAAQSNPPRP